MGERVWREGWGKQRVAGLMGTRGEMCLHLVYVPDDADEMNGMTFSDFSISLSSSAVTFSILDLCDECTLQLLPVAHVQSNPF